MRGMVALPVEQEPHKWEERRTAPTTRALLTLQCESAFSVTPAY